MQHSKTQGLKTSFLNQLFKWLVLCSLTGMLAGTASAFFLLALEWVTHLRENNGWLILLLPLAGLVIGLSYYLFGKEVVKGNNLLIEEFQEPKNKIPFKMAPLVLFGTLLTHLVGGSAGREGTAVQMGGAIADQFRGLFQLTETDRKTLLLVGISAGFASVFGTPLAGAVFALEIMLIQQLNYRMVLPVFLSAYLAAYVCNLWGVQHTHYHLGAVPAITFTHLCWTLLVGLLSGLTARLFSASTHFCTDFFKNWINYPPLRPLAGGAVLALVIYFTASDKYIGLGVPTIVAAFSEPMNGYDFLLKILFTAFTLGAGFKGGEVTPLFFIGATLGNALIWFIPLPLGLLAGMGFVAVFSGATHAPLACALMGMELFGIESGVYLTIACITAYFFSGEKGIYSSQQVGNPKRWLHQRLKLIFPSKIKTS